MNRLLLTTTLLPVLLFLGCATSSHNHNITTLNPLQLQTRTFQANKEQTFHAVMTVLQNQGYIINAASLESGFISATGQTAIHSINTSENKQSNTKANTATMVAAAILTLGAVVEAVETANHDHSHHAYQTNDKKPDIVTYQPQVSATFTQKSTLKNKPTTEIRLNFVEQQFHHHIPGERQPIITIRLYQKTFNAIRQQLFIMQPVS